MKTRSRVSVLMATFNGELYLREQMESILEQEGVDITLMVRDDGSNDSTISIINSYNERCVLNIIKGNHLGPAKGFLQLLQISTDEADFYAFSDQDDFWKKDKLSVATNMLKNAGSQPALYFCQTQLVDKYLNPIPSPSISPFLTFGESLIYEFVSGCTMVMNKSLRDIINSYTPEYLPMHDVWIYSIAQAIGAKIYFDEQPHILYRQHSNNTIGQGYSIWHEWNRRWQRFRNNEESRSRRAKEILKGYSDYITKENLSILNSFINGKSSILQRIKLIHDKRLRCANRTTQFLFWLNLLINKY